MHLWVPLRFLHLLPPPPPPPPHPLQFLRSLDLLPTHVLYIAITSVRCQTKTYPNPVIVEGAKRIFGVNKQTVYSDLIQCLEILHFEVKLLL